MSNAESVVDGYMDDSAVWVDALDRSALGSFAVNREALIVVHAQETHNNAISNGDSRFDLDIVNVFEEKVMEFLPGGFESGFDEDLLLDAVSELCVWLLMDDASDMTAHVEYLREVIGGLNEGIAAIRQMLENPAALPFFEVGIRDLDFINECVASGIDPSLALDMLPVVAAA